MKKKLLRYLNPISQLGNSHYSLVFPLITSLCTVLLLEFIVYVLLGNPEAVGLFAIFIFVFLIIYFSFRDGIKGGLTATAVTIAYYFYIMHSRDYTGDRLRSGIETTFALGLLYIALASIIGWLKQTIDVLIEKESDEKRRFQTIMQQLPVGVIVTNNKGVIEFANKHADIILGTKVPLGFTVGENFFVNVIESNPSPPSQSILAKVLSTGKPVINEFFLIEKVNKKKVYIDVSASPIKNTKGQVIAAAEILNDVTTQRELEKRKDDFINMASHELRTPLTSLKLYLTALQKKLQKNQHETELKIFNSIMSQTDRLQNLVSELLDVSRLQTGKLTFTKEPVALHTLINDVIDELQTSMEGVTISYKFQTQVEVSADKFRLYQVLTNLISNAAKYSPGKKTIHVRLKKIPKYALVSVQDFGIGINKEEQKRIFERLYQVPEPQEKTYPGLGMGLYISSEIIKRHRGKIWVESIKGKGSTFYFRLPLSKT